MASCNGPLNRVQKVARVSMSVASTKFFGLNNSRERPIASDFEHLFSWRTTNNVFLNLKRMVLCVNFVLIPDSYRFQFSITFTTIAAVLSIRNMKWYEDIIWYRVGGRAHNLAFLL
eukprot:TRINITY_DN42603_c0_g1_i1.p1 TRINITY_DN42603_c0_g1~~TRINITY_DN42603_c0_g1_i1.p1  ORF type:complete len:116 (-),score=6.20 TRINITY_DN42603_c0_g1_i1:1844-2191(-)